MATPIYPEVQAAIVVILEEVQKDLPAAVKAMKGRDGGFRPSRPKNGIMGYLWRWVRFHANIDSHMPVMDDTYLVEGLKEALAAKGITEFRDADPNWKWSRKTDLSIRDVPKDTLKALDQFVDKIARAYKLDPNAGARRWGRAFGIIP